MLDYIIHTDDKGGHSREIPIAFKKQRRYFVERDRLVKLSNDLGPGIANDRWLNILEFRRRSMFGRNQFGYFHMNTHWNAAIQDRPTGRIKDVARARAMNLAGARLENEIKRMLSAGREGFVTGDFNYRGEKQASEDWYWSPENIFERTRMHYRNVGLDWIAWTNGMVRLGPIEVIQPNEGGNQSDHPWLIGNFRRK
jgi:hypothetical protein